MINQNPKPTPKHRVLIATPTTGLVRMEWVMARYTQNIPTNWGEVDFTQWYNTYTPIGYQVNDAENIIAKVLVEGNFDWLLFLEHDNVIPPGTFVKMNEYMIEGKIPVVAALYFTKSDPPEPMVYREWGHGYHDKWRLGDKVWVRGCPFGCTLIHASLIKELWKSAPEYSVGNQTTRRVFHGPENPDEATQNGFFINKGTSDLAFCKELVEKRIFEKAGWKEYQKKKYPILIDTSIFVKHIDQDGNQWPMIVPKKYAPKGTIL
jgi:hypothetical protein